jgi:electron transport complex protein RnfB
MVISPDIAEHYIKVGIGQPASKQELLKVLEKAQEAGLVIQPINDQQPEAVCLCCGDCCGILTALKKFPRPADYYASNFYAHVDPQMCNGCEDCLSRCQLGAPQKNDGVVTINLDRCIGCGNCVTICAANAIRLQKKAKETVPPKDIFGTYNKIMAKKASKVTIAKIGAKMLLKQKV